MYIRTECGMIVSLEDGYYEVNGEQLIDEKYGRWEIKSQGDNLIDVLEFGDILCHYNENNILTKRMFVKVLDIKIGFVGSSADSGIFKDQLPFWKIITHEQYLPLAQEVK
jgi:hypothetical protein